MVLKTITLIFKAFIILVVLALLVLGVIGGGWGSKDIPVTHQFYQGTLSLVAHRGVSDQAPENTLASAARAQELGFKFIELDIKQSKDSLFYLFHDRDGHRLFGTNNPLKGYTLSELQQMPLLHQGLPSDYRVPSWEEFNRQFSDELIFYIDVKRHGNYNYTLLADQITKILTEAGLTDQSMVGSDFLFTAYLEFRFPELHTVFTGPGDWSIVFYKWIPKKFRPDFIISYAEEVTDWHLQWLNQNKLINRRMLYGIDKNNYHKVRKWGIPYLVVEYDPVMQQDL